MNKKELIARSKADAMIPVRPGNTKEQKAFWNGNATHFMHVPSFEFKKVKGAKSYRFSVCDRMGTVRTFTADSPYALLAPVWEKLAIGPVTVDVAALDERGHKIADSGSRFLYRKPYFTDSYPPKPRSYDEAAKQTFEYLFHLEAIQDLKKGKLLPGQPPFGYPSKMYSAVISGMVNYAELVPEKKKEALDIAVKAAEALIQTAVPAGEPLEYLPRTYAEKDMEQLIFLIYPCDVGSAMIQLAKASGKKKYLDYAKKIGDQYLRLQQPNGSWYLSMSNETGHAAGLYQPDGAWQHVTISDSVKPSFCGPAGIFSFLEELSAASGCESYRKATLKGEGYFNELLKSFNWEGQFEDTVSKPQPYSNLAHGIAVEVMTYLCRHDPKNKKYRAYAREIARYAEDQFIVWEQPGWLHTPDQFDRFRFAEDDRMWGWHTWHTPVALEQYRCYTPVDASAAVLLRYFLMLYDLEHDPMDLAKARALGDSLVRLQMANGRIPTWCRDTDTGIDWINCMFFSARALKQLAAYESVKI